MLLVDNGSTSCDALADRLTRLGCLVDRREHSNASLSGEHLGVVLSGRARPSRDSNVHNFKLISEAYSKRVPLLGICYGAEILALAFDGTLRKLQEHRMETRRISVIKSNQLLKDESFMAHESHSFRIGTVPVDFETLARSEVSQNEAVKHKKADLYGVQFHPELSDESGIRILGNFAHLCLSSSIGDRR